MLLAGLRALSLHPPQLKPPNANLPAASPPPSLRLPCCLGFLGPRGGPSGHEASEVGRPSERPGAEGPWAVARAVGWRGARALRARSPIACGDPSTGPASTPGPAVQVSTRQRRAAARPLQKENEQRLRNTVARLRPHLLACIPEQARGVPHQTHEGSHLAGFLGFSRSRCRAWASGARGATLAGNLASAPPPPIAPRRCRAPGPHTRIRAWGAGGQQGNTSNSKLWSGGCYTVRNGAPPVYRINMTCRGPAWHERRHERDNRIAWPTWAPAEKKKSL